MACFTIIAPFPSCFVSLSSTIVTACPWERREGDSCPPAACNLLEAERHVNAASLQQKNKNVSKSNLQLSLPPSPAAHAAHHYASRINGELGESPTPTARQGRLQMPFAPSQGFHCCTSD